MSYGFVTSYEHDPRVHRVSEYFYAVSSDDEYSVSAWIDPHRWHWSPSLDNRALHAAGIRSREEADGWLKAATRGPFPNAEAALRDLLGEPLRADS